MSVKRSIQKAYDPIHAPEDVIERMKQELYQKDLNQDEEHEIFHVETAPRLGFVKYFMYTAAAIAVCCGMGYAYLKAQDYRIDFHPAKAVYTEAVEQYQMPDVTGLSKNAAVALLGHAGITLQMRYASSDQPAGTVIAQSIEPGETVDPEGYVVITIAE